MIENKKDDIAYGRMVIHMATGLFAVFFMQVYPLKKENLELLLHISAGTYIFFIEILRLCGNHYWKDIENPEDHPWYGWYKLHNWCVKWSLHIGILREKELEDVSSGSWYILGLYVTYFLFITWIALIAMLSLAFGDPMARLFGIGFKGVKRSWLMGKTIIGAYGFFMTALFVVLMTIILDIWFPFYPSSIGLAGLLLVVGIGVFIGMLSEIYGGAVDNLAIPVFAGKAMQLYYLYVILGG